MGPKVNVANFFSFFLSLTLFVVLCGSTIESQVPCVAALRLVCVPVEVYMHVYVQVSRLTHD